MPTLKKGTLIPSDAEDADIRAGIEADPDTDELTEDTLQYLRPMGRPKKVNPKESINIRISPEVATFFRSTGKGWQTRIDEVLKAYVAGAKNP